MKRIRQVPIETLVCTRSVRAYKNGWSFPRTVEKLLMEATAGKSVLHLFGGLSRWGTRLDVDARTSPDVIGDAWLPPFARDSFDIVILDPPYEKFCSQSTMALFAGAAWIAREQVIWFHTLWVDHPARMKLNRAILVVVGRNASVRCLQFMDVPRDKLKPIEKFKRGPAIKYNKWLRQPQGLPFGDGHYGSAGIPETSPARRT